MVVNAFTVGCGVLEKVKGCAQVKGMQGAILQKCMGMKLMDLERQTTSQPR